MTKLRTHTVLAYLEGEMKRRSKQGPTPSLSDISFPPEFTAEAVAERFGASLSSSLAKLNAMADAGLLISKRGEIEGRPGKRLVFLVKSALADDGQALDAAIPYQGTRDLLYILNSCSVELNAKADAHVARRFIIRNVTHRALTEIPLPKVRYDVYGGKGVYEHLESVKLNGREVPYSSDALIFFKGKKPGKCGLGGGYYDKDDGSMHYVEIVYVIPLETPLQPGDAVEVEMTATYPKAYADMHKFEYLSVKIREMTIRAELKVVAPKGYAIASVKQYEDAMYRHGVFVIDASTEKRKPEVEAEMKAPKVTSSSIQWEIEKPVIGYLYGFPFAVRKGGPRPRVSSRTASRR